MTTISKLNRNKGEFNRMSLNELDFLKKIQTYSNIKIESYTVKYFKPTTRSMVDFIPITELHPLISLKYYYIRELLRIKKLKQMNLAELQPSNKLRDVVNNASNELLSSLHEKLKQFGQMTHKISYKIEQCVVHVVTSQSIDGVSYVYGNIFALVKLGFFTTVWYNYTKCDPTLYPGDILPDTFLDFYLKEKFQLNGYDKFVFMENKENMTQSIVKVIEGDLFNEKVDSIHIPEIEELEPLGGDKLDELISSSTDEKKSCISDTKTKKDSNWLPGIGVGVMICLGIAAWVLGNRNS